MALAILLAKRRARSVSLRGLKREIRAATLAAGLVNPSAALGPKAMERLVSERAVDRRAAQRIGRSFAKRWSIARDRAAEEGLATPRRAASRATLPRLNSTIATETSQAFSGARRAAAADVERALADANPDNIGDMVVGLRWFAVLDACPACSANDGETIRAGDTWPSGSPGDVHPNCRCIDTVVIVRKSEITK